jgi:Tol biopolymer transport system component
VIVRADGSTLRRLPRTFNQPAWSPDGRRLAGFDRHRVAIVDARGHERLTRGRPGWEARGLAWSPDGRTIAWIGRAGSYGISFVDAATGKLVNRWVSARGFAGGNPTWDATGVYITKG